MRELASEHRILELHLEALGRADLAVDRERAAEHGGSDRQRTGAGVAYDQVVGRSHVRDRTLLVERALAVALGVGAQDEALPVRKDLVIAPRLAPDRLGAHLLG